MELFGLLRGGKEHWDSDSGDETSDEEQGWLPSWRKQGSSGSRRDKYSKKKKARNTGLAGLLQRIRTMNPRRSESLGMILLFVFLGLYVYEFVVVATVNSNSALVVSSSIAKKFTETEEKPSSSFMKPPPPPPPVAPAPPKEEPKVEEPPKAVEPPPVSAETTPDKSSTLMSNDLQIPPNDIIAKLPDPIQHTVATTSEGTSTIDSTNNASSGGTNIPAQQPPVDAPSQAGAISSPLASNGDEDLYATTPSILSADEVAAYYGKLADKYLEPFKGGINRNLFNEMFMRKNYKITPDGANKAVQTLLFQIKDQRVYVSDPYDVMGSEKSFYKSRISEVIWLLSKLAKEGRVKETEFMIAVHDCVQTVSKAHNYRMAKFTESMPMFTIVTCNFSDNIPFPMWEGQEDRGGSYATWDANMVEYAKDPYPWETKVSQAVFRGGMRVSAFFNDKADGESKCDLAGRGKLMSLQDQNPALFNFSMGGKCKENSYSLKKLKPEEHHMYKYIVYAEGNCFWADRLNRQLFGPSAIIKQLTPCGQFFEPLMKPYEHYIPTDFFFSDLVEATTWAKEHEEDVKKIVTHANNFAKSFLSSSGILSYVEVVLNKYTELLSAPVVLEDNAREVTDMRLS